jgi:hypothetical protein
MINCQNQGYYFEIILGRQDSLNSVTYQAKYDGITWFLPPCNYQPGHSGSSVQQIIYTNLDSTIFYYHTHALGCDTTNFCYKDSAYIDTAYYNGRKIDIHYEGNAAWASYDTSFADGLGEVGAGYGSEDNTAAQGGFGLIYYHLVSGEVWGYPYYFTLPNGIGEVSNDMSVTVIPNPVTGDFQIKINNTPAGQNVFNLYDETGRTFMQKTITGSNTQMSREGIMDGLYFWSMTSDGVELSHGKIVFE